MGYALENRLVLVARFPELYRQMNVQRLAPFFREFSNGLTAIAERSDPRICLLTPGPFSQTYFEQAYLARYLGFLLVEGDDLSCSDGEAHVRTIAGLKRADVIWRRVDADLPIRSNPTRIPISACRVWSGHPQRQGGCRQHARLGLVESPRADQLHAALCRA